jgi:magnesium transporter
MVMTRKIGGFVWHDLVGRSEEGEALLRDLGLGERFIDDMLGIAIHPKAVRHEGFLFTVVHGLDLDYAQEDDEFELETLELDVMIGSDWIVTHADSPLEVIRRAASRIEEDPSLAKTPGELLHVVLDTLVDEYDPFLVQFIPQRIDAIEEELFNDRLSAAVRREIYLRRRDVIRLQRVAAPQAMAMRTLAELAKDTPFTREEAPLIHESANRLAWVASQTTTLRAELDSAFDHYLSAVANSQNEVMRVLTMVSAIILPMTFIAGIYGMNFVHMPELVHPYGYPIALGLMAVVGMIGFWYFRRRGWIGRGPLRLPGVQEIPVLGQVLRLPAIGARAVSRLAPPRLDRYDRSERR